MPIPFPDPDMVANRGNYPDLVDGKPGKGPKVPTPSFACLNDGKGHFPTCEALPTESATSIVAADLDGDGTRPVRPAPRWRPEHHFVERWEGSFPDIYESWACHCLDPHGRRQRL